MGTESSPTKTFAFPPSTITAKLCNLRKEGVLIDSSIFLHDDEFPCHSAVVSLFSELLKTKLFSSSKLDDLVSLFYLLPDSSLFFKVLNSFYGLPLKFTFQDLYHTGVVSTYLKYTNLSHFLALLIASELNLKETFTFQLNHDVIVANFRKFAPSHVSITYKEVHIQTNSLILVATSATFLNQFSTSFNDSNDRKITYESEFEGVEEDIFEQFFNLFYSDSIKVNISNVLSFYQLSFYFQVPELLEACKTFLLTNTFTDLELLSLLNSANVRHQVRFVEEILNIFKNLSQPLKLDSLPLSVEILQMLFPIVDNWWLIQCLLETFKNQELTSQELNSILKLIDIHHFDYNNLYTLIQPLFDEKSFESVLLQWSVQNFSNIKQLEKIPPQWFLWTFQAADRAKSNLEYVVDIFMKVVPFEFLHSYQGFCPSPLALKLLSPSVTADYLSFFAKSMVDSEKLTSEELYSILILIDIHQFNYNNLYTLIQPLFDEKSFESVLLQWSVDNFPNIKQLDKIPPNWFLWTFQAADRAKSDLEYFVVNFMTVVPFEFLNSYQGFSPSPLAFKLLSPSVTADYSTFLAKSLVDSWRNFDWDVDVFHDCVNGFDLKVTDPVAIFEIFSDLKNDSKLFQFFQKYFADNALLVLNFQKNELLTMSQQKKTLDDLVQNLNNDKSELEKNVVTLKQRNSQLSQLFFSFTFTNAGKTGRTGPSLEDCIGAYHHEYFKNIENFNVIDGIQHWTVPLTGMYRIECAGARGGNNNYNTSTKPGKGAVMIGEFELKSGQIIKILVGQVGCDAKGGMYVAGGGGGGSFVVLDSSPLIVAGGGNGQNLSHWKTNGSDGRVDFTEGVGKGGYGAGGGGFTLDCQNATSGNSTGGKSFLNGGMGGQSDTGRSITAHGGFGCGGGARYEGGGGGGYTGGSVVPQNQHNNTYPSYGAGSFNSGLNPVNTSGSNDGDGFVKIHLL
ncbi:hypothetical protein GEMRC1_005703 [Eukaryota sp. GEM-RC1]